MALSGQRTTEDFRDFVCSLVLSTHCNAQGRGHATIAPLSGDVILFVIPESLGRGNGLRREEAIVAQPLYGFRPREIHTARNKVNDTAALTGLPSSLLATEFIISLRLTALHLPAICIPPLFAEKACVRLGIGSLSLSVSPDVSPRSSCSVVRTAIAPSGCGCIKLLDYSLRVRFKDDSGTGVLLKCGKIPDFAALVCFCSLQPVLPA